MVMGPTHSMSGLFFGLAGITAFNALTTGLALHPSIALLGSIIVAGAALAPDIDSHSSTVVRSFGIFGWLGHKLADGLSIAVYNLTRTKYDETKTDGHRTLFHTIIMAIVMGVVTTLLCTPTNPITVFGQEMIFGQFMALVLSGIYINLMLAGIFEKKIKKLRNQFGPYALLLVSFVLAVGLAFFLPERDDSTGIDTYAWLGISVAIGNIVHLLGDAITKLGVPMFWPLKIRGKRWYDITLPAFLRIKAGGQFEYVVLLPLFTLGSVALFVWNVVAYMNSAVGLV